MHATARHRALALLFIALLALPWLAGMAGLADAPEDPAPWPEAALLREDPAAYASALAAAFRANFPLRREAIRLNHRARLALTGEPALATVVAGTDGQFFYNAEWAMEDSLGVLRLEEAELAAIAADAAARRDWLARRGIPFVVVIAPNPQTLFPECLPARYRHLGDGTRLDRTLAALRGAGVNAVDLRPALLAAKAHLRPYARTDSHWNDWGAFLAAREIAAAVRAAGVPARLPDLDDYELFEADDPGGDLAGMLLLKDQLHERGPRLVARASRLRDGAPAAFPNPATLPGRELVIREGDDPALPRALVFRDSFGIRLIPFLSGSFSRAVYVWEHRFVPGAVLAERPDVVIHELAERYQHAFLLPLPPLPE